MDRKSTKGSHVKSSKDEFSNIPSGEHDMPSREIGNIYIASERQIENPIQSTGILHAFHRTWTNFTGRLMGFIYHVIGRENQEQIPHRDNLQKCTCSADKKSICEYHDINTLYLISQSITSVDKLYDLSISLGVAASHAEEILTDTSRNVNKAAFLVLKEFFMNGLPQEGWYEIRRALEQINRGSVVRELELDKLRLTTHCEQKTANSHVFTIHGGERPLNEEGTIGLIVPPTALEENTVFTWFLKRNGEELPELTIDAQKAETEENSTLFKRHVMISFRGLRRPHTLGVKVDGNDLPEQDINAHQSCILHTFIRVDSMGITIFARHFSTFQLYCKKHKKNRTYEAYLTAVLFRRQQYAEGVMSVNVKVVLDVQNTNRTDNQETWKIHDAGKYSLIETVCLITPPSTEVMQPDGTFTVTAIATTKNWICTNNDETRSLESVIPCLKCNTGNLPDAAVLQFKSMVPNPESFRVKMRFNIKATKTAHSWFTDREIVVDVLPNTNWDLSAVSAAQANGYRESNRSPEVDEIGELTDEAMFNVSRRLHQKSDIHKLALQLGFDSNTIEAYFTNHGHDYREVAHYVLSEWRKTQENDFIAYENLCCALVHPKVNLRRIAAQELGYRQ